ncbi:hypothetical protein GCM10011491_46880 [Brucella endophytica]|uniref:Uncharacterized protein n=1 Tax=Brucella endophytica TaxID=1963359 RepID=A0A916WNA3_9HYPH|nr:hypothetical protein GCM10011491_46880 [Brucella endophytica]
MFLPFQDIHLSHKGPRDLAPYRTLVRRGSCRAPSGASPEGVRREDKTKLMLIAPDERFAFAGR